MTDPGQAAAPPAHSDPAPSNTVTLHDNTDVGRARHRVRQLAIELNMDLVTQTKIITAASELARNTVLHGQGGEMRLSVVHRQTHSSTRQGLELLFIDHGPGITDIERAMTSGWTSGTGLGLGLPGSRSLVNEFELISAPGEGTQVRVIMWVRER